MSRGIGLATLLSVTLGTGCAAPSDRIDPAANGQLRAVVFDIDGTLTPRVSAIRTARDGAAEAVRAYARAGCEIVYLSARHPLWQPGIRAWLRDQGFPDGNIQLVRTRQDRQDHSAFKLRVLRAFESAGWRFLAAYGDSSTDFEAYVRAGIDSDRIFALKREREDACEPGPWSACFGNWPDQMSVIHSLSGARR